LERLSLRFQPFSKGLAKVSIHFLTQPSLHIYSFVRIALPIGLDPVMRIVSEKYFFSNYDRLIA
jgi:hypothetical protein